VSLITEAKIGLADALKAVAEIKRVYRQPPDSQTITQLPAAVLLTEPIIYSLAMGGTHWRGVLRVKLLIHKGDSTEAYDLLDDLLDPSGDKSVAEAIQNNRTLGGKVDDAAVIRAENIGGQDVGGVRYVAADLLVEIIRTRT
jgi:hypothetical protein